MAYTPIDKSSDYFNIKLYTGNATNPTTISEIGFQPDWVWTKLRAGGTEGHRLCDAVRGATKDLLSNTNDAELTNTIGLKSFNSDGYVIGNSNGYNFNNGTFVSWNWLANNTTGSTNTAGSINSTVAVNTTSGFSIVSYVGTGNAETVGHGLGVKPDMIFSKPYSAAGDWNVYNDSFAAQQRIKLNSTAGVSTNSGIFSSLPTPTLVNIGTSGDINANGTSHLFYCFNSVQGYSKFGSYVGNGSTDGTFVYTGFKPAWLMIKGTSSNRNWNIIDVKRDTFNPSGDFLQANTSAVEDTSSIDIDFLSNGFKLRITSARVNAAETYIYMAFAENPFVTSTGVPACAR
jgi:hypothetical protein